MLNKSFYFKQVWAKGKLVCGYSSIKILGAVTAIVFERLNTEFNYAVGHGLLIQDYYFASSTEEIAQSIGFTIKEVENALKHLEELSLIATNTIDNIYLIHLDLDKICDFISETERKNNYEMWDCGLQQIQSAAFNVIEFNAENKKIIEKIKNSMYELALDENGQPYKF